MIDQTADVLLFSSTAKGVATLQKLLPQIDDSKGQVMVRGLVYEVSSSDKDGSALGLVLSLLGSRVSIVGGAASSLDNFVRLNTGSIDAVFSAQAKMCRFLVLCPIQRQEAHQFKTSNINLPACFLISGQSCGMM